MANAFNPLLAYAQISRSLALRRLRQPRQKAARQRPVIDDRSMNQADLTAQLQSLKSLLDNGAIDEGEYEQLKKSLIAKL